MQLLSIEVSEKSHDIQGQGLDELRDRLHKVEIAFIKDERLIYLEGLAKLETLGSSFCIKLTDKCLNYLIGTVEVIRLKSLQQLNFSFCENLTKFNPVLRFGKFYTA